MKIAEIAPKPPTPDQLRIDALKATKERAGQAVAAERQRQQIAKAQKTMTAAKQVKPMQSSVQ